MRKDHNILKLVNGQIVEIDIKEPNNRLTNKCRGMCSKYGEDVIPAYYHIGNVFCPVLNRLISFCTNDFIGRRIHMSLFISKLIINGEKSINTDIKWKDNEN